MRTVGGIGKPYSRSPRIGLEAAAAVAVDEEGGPKDVDEGDGGERSSGGVGSYGQRLVTRHNSSSCAGRSTWSGCGSRGRGAQLAGEGEGGS
jgi:hypothetical protein